MYYKYLLSICVVFLIAIAQPSFAGDQESLKKMANIMMDLNHYPSDSEKNQLAEIAKTSQSEHVKTIANAMRNLHHSASAEDKRQLKQVMDDADAPDKIKSLAAIVYNLNHKPSAQDKQQLSTMINFASDM